MPTTATKKPKSGQVIRSVKSTVKGTAGGGSSTPTPTTGRIYPLK